MVEIAEPLVEPVHRRQELVAVAQVVLAELGGVVAARLQHLGQRRILLLDAARRSRDADRGHAGADRQLTRDEGGAAGSAARLPVVIGEQDPLLGDAVDVGRPAHHPVRIGADVPVADVVAPDDQDVRPLARGRLRLGSAHPELPIPTRTPPRVVPQQKVAPAKSVSARIQFELRPRRAAAASLVGAHRLLAPIMIGSDDLLLCPTRHSLPMASRRCTPAVVRRHCLVPSLCRESTAWPSAPGVSMA